MRRDVSVVGELLLTVAYLPSKSEGLVYLRSKDVISLMLAPILADVKAMNIQGQESPTFEFSRLR